MRDKRLKSISKLSAAVALFSALAACGGGGGGSTTTTSAGGSSTPPVSVTSSADGKLHAACTSCGAVNDSTYSGSGVGVWQATNATNSAENLTLSISGLSNKSVTLVYTNQSGATVPLQSITVSSAMLNAAVSQSATGSSTTGEDPRVAKIREFNATGWKQAATTGSTANAGVSQSQLVVAPNPTYVVGTSTRTFNDANNPPQSHTTTLEKQATTGDGTTVNIWVESTEYGPTKVSDSIISTLMTNYAGTGGVYDMVTGVGGKLYGTNSVAGTISGTGQPIDLVVLNITPDGVPYGEVGYFYGLNNFLTSANVTNASYSNQSISLYLDSETLYLGGADGMRSMQTVMAHESTHMQNFYRRALLKGNAYATWLEEMSAMMMEDWVSFNIDTTYNAIRDSRFPYFMTWTSQGGSFGCGLTTWVAQGATCDSYSTNGSFGGFLNRQLGLQFYKNLLNDFSSTDSVAILNDAINTTRAGATMASMFTDFAVASESKIPASLNFGVYSFPARAEGGFTLPLIDPSLYTRTLPATSPASLEAYASLPLVRSNVSGTYTETINIPAGVVVSVIVQ